MKECLKTISSSPFLDYFLQYGIKSVGKKVDACSREKSEKD